MRKVASVLACVGIAVSVAGCATHQTGPNRPISIEEDVAFVKVLAQPDDLASFYRADPTTQAIMRNQIVTARMYIADMEYHLYESRLTREIQDEGLLATATSLGLTTSATLIPVAQTKTLLSGIATGVTGLDKAYNEKVLLSSTIQALQTQMRADRKEQAGAIYAKMFKGPSILTPIAEYTLPMALSDADAYYQAGTISSALIGLSKTLAAKENRSDQAKSDAGPNPDKVTAVKETATPPAVTTTPTLRITSLARDNSYATLRAQIFPGGAKTADAQIVAYIKDILGPPPIAVGVILTDARFTALRQKISACIVARGLGQPCASGSLAAFR